MDGWCRGRARRGPRSRRRRRRHGRTGQAAGNAAQGGPRHRHRWPQRQGLQRACVQRPQGRPAPVRRQGPRLHLEERRRTTSRTSRLAPRGLRPRDRGRLPHGRLDRPGREEVPEDEVRDHRRQRGRPQGQAEERPWHRVRRAGGRVPRRCRSCDHFQVRHDLVGRRSQDPARRRVHRRLPVLRQEGEAGHQDAQRLLAGLRRAGQVQVGRSRPDRSGL